MSRVFFILLVMVLFGCKSEVTPEGGLKKYIDYRFSPNQDRAGLLEITYGEMHEKIKNMTEDELAKFVATRDLQQKDFKILLKKCSEKQCDITYVLSYISLEQGKSDYLVEIKKIATLNNVDNIWKLSEINNVKSFINMQVPIDIVP